MAQRARRCRCPRFEPLGPLSLRARLTVDSPALTSPRSVAESRAARPGPRRTAPVFSDNQILNACGSSALGQPATHVVRQWIKTHQERHPTSLTPKWVQPSALEWCLPEGSASTPHCTPRQLQKGMVRWRWCWDSSVILKVDGRPQFLVIARRSMPEGQALMHREAARLSGLILYIEANIPSWLKSQ